MQKLVEKSLRVYGSILQQKKVKINLMHDRVEEASTYVQERRVQNHIRSTKNGLHVDYMNLNFLITIKKRLDIIF